MAHNLTSKSAPAPQPDPHRPSTAAGHGASGDGFKLTVETVNVTCWTSAKAYIPTVEDSVHVLMIQEHKLFEDAVDEASQWCEASFQEANTADLEEMQHTSQ